MAKFESIQIPHGIDKIVNDIRKLGKIGKIHSIEIALDREVELKDELISYCQGKGGLIYANEIIFINFPEVGIKNIQNVLTQIYFLGGEMEIIESLLIHMENTLGTSYHCTVEINVDSKLPSLISISDKSHYFTFLNNFQIRWCSLK